MLSTISPPLLGFLAIAAAGAPSANPGPAVRSVILLPTVPLGDADGYAPPADRVDQAWAAVRKGADLGHLPAAAWLYSGETPSGGEAAQVLARMPTRAMPADIQQLLDEAAAAKKEFDDARQIKQLQAAVQQMNSRLEELGQTETLIAAEIDLGVAYLATNERAFAEAEFGRVVRMRPDVELDLRRFAPNVLEVFNQVKQRILAEPTTDLTVDVAPKNAVVSVNGFVVGQSPKVVPVRKGLYVVQVFAPGYDALTRVVQATGTDPIRLDDQLRRERVHQIADGLLATLRKGGELTKALPAARALAEAVGADAVLVSGLTEVKGGYALVAVLSTEPPRRWVGTFDDSFAKAEETATAIMSRVATPRSGPRTELEPVTVEARPLSVEALHLAFDQKLLGLASGGPRPVATMVSGGNTTTLVMQVAPKQGCAADDPPAYCHAWPWITLGGAVLAGAAVTIALMRSSPTTVNDKVKVHLIGPSPIVGPTSP